MSDLIDRVAVLEDLEKRMADDYVDAARFAEYIRTLPSAEPERTAKVIKHKYRLGVSLNVVGEPTIGYEWLCENCKKKVIDGDDYCSHCGSKLIWDEEE